MAIVMEFILHCRHCDINRAFVDFKNDDATVRPMGGSVMHITFKGMSPTNHLCTVRQANECLTTSLLAVFTGRNFVL